MRPATPSALHQSDNTIAMSPEAYVKQEKLTALARDLIRIPSLAGQETQIAAYVQEYLTAAGFEAATNDYNTVVAVLRGGEGPTILLDAHIDTVDANPGEWTHHPYAAEIDGGAIYGRGATDMKGALAAMMRAGETLAAEGISRGNLIVTATSWEERFEGHTLGIAIEDLSSRGLRPDYVIIGEASQLNIKRGQRGRTRIHFDVKGRAAHSAHPEEGVNAVYKALALAQRIREMPLPADDFLGRGIIELIGIDSLPRPIDSVVPFGCQLSYDLRLLPGETKASVLDQFRAVVDVLASEDPDFHADFHITQGELTTRQGEVEIIEAFPPAWKIPEDHILVGTARAALRSIGLDPQVTKYDFCTNGSYSAGIAGIPTIGFGPGAESGAHIIDEHIAIEELEKACLGYEAIVRRVLQL